ncbi:STN domain-containing protein [Alcanivorax sp. MM125-6]|nr:STN domain-containing protein [Alcanivorax sp. MM125-6]UWN51327.1 hypothetical protein ASALC70_03554 [Alcanivorax sp. ALC70]
MRDTLMMALGAGALVLAGCTGQDRAAPMETGKCDAVVSYDLPAQRFDETAQQLAHATGCFIEADTDEIGAVQVQPVAGRMSIRQALETALDGTGLAITEHAPNTLKVE